MSKVRWGILGPGSIAKQFARGIELAPNAELAAAGSRSLEKARQFVLEFGGGRAHGSYEDLVADPEVDAIYVATPHPFHKPHTLLALSAGKSVLCEKPFAMRAEEAGEMVSMARSKDLYLMEGMWTRFFPVMAKVREWLAEGAIGAVRTVYADFGFRAGFNPESRIFSPDLGGGGLLDVGIYPISFASMVFGTPDRVTGFMQPAPSGVDAQAGIVLSKGNQMAVLHTAVEVTTPWCAVILGEAGRIEVASPFWKPSRCVLRADVKDESVFESPYEGSGFQFEAEAASADILAGRKESGVIPLDESLAIMGTMDELRRQWGLTYPGE